MKGSMIIHPEELSREWVDRLVDAGVQVLGIHPWGGKEAAKSLERLIGQMQEKEYREVIDYAKERGLAVEYELHAAGYLLPRSLFAEHPEYFRMDEHGERTENRNFCVTNEEALSLYASRAADLACALYGSSPRFYFWMDDGHGLQCHCPSCRRYTPSEQQMLALNAALREIRKRIPEARMAYLAYMDSILPPQAVTPEKGVFLEYAPFEKYTAKGEDAPEKIAREKEMIPALMDCFAREDRRVLEYWYDNSLYSGWKKPPKRFVPDEGRMRTDIEEYRRMGFSEIATFACFLGADYEELHGEVDVRPFADALHNE